ncbi:MAG: hypothetical protein RIQ81_1122 [Pseudomonadota bacterium]|jgi:DNA-binding transcriptional LysR family regulator
MEHLDLNHLEIFMHVVEARSFSNAAKNLAIPKSKASRAVSTLEQVMGGQLLYRTTRDVTATELGLRLYNHISSGMTALKVGLTETRRESIPMSGTIRITSVEDVGTHIVTPVLARFSAKYPGLKFDMIYTLKVMDLVKDGIDIAIRVGAVSQQSYRVRKVGMIRFIFVASPRYLERQSIGRVNLARPEVLQDLDLLMLTLKPADPARVDLKNGDQRITVRLKPKHVSNATEALIALAVAGGGVALVPDFMARPGLHDGSLVEVCKGWHLAPMPVSIVTPARRKLSPVVEAFTGFLQEGLKQEFT